MEFEDLMKTPMNLMPRFTDKKFSEFRDLTCKRKFKNKMKTCRLSYLGQHSNGERGSSG